MAGSFAAERRGGSLLADYRVHRTRATSVDFIVGSSIAHRIDVIAADLNEKYTQYDPAMRIERTPAVRKLLVALCILGACAYLGLLLRHTCYFASGPDSSGYLSEAKLFGSGRLRVPVAPLRDLRVERSMIDVFVPLGFLPGSPGTMVPTYAPGLPLHMLAFALLCGWSIGPFLVSSLAAVGCLLLMYALGKEIGLSSAWAALAPVLLAPVAVFIAFAMQPMSDVVAAFWVSLTIWCGLRARRNGFFAYLAGVALAIAVAVRPTNTLAALPLLVAIPFELRAWRNVVLGAFGPGAAFLWLNAVQHGSPFQFGVSSVSDVLTWRPPGVCAGFHLWWTMRMLTPLAIGLAVIALFLRSISCRHRLMLVGWFGALLTFYSFYNYCPGWNAIRFMLPAYPAVILAVLLLLQRVTSQLVARGRRRFAYSAACIAVLLILAGQIDVTSEFRVFRVDDHESVFPETVQWTERMVPPNALVVSGVFSGAFYYYGRWTVRWDRLDADRFMLLRAYVGNADRRWYAVISDGEVTRQEFLSRLPGVWTAVGRNRDVTLYRLDD